MFKRLLAMAPTAASVPLDRSHNAGAFSARSRDVGGDSARAITFKGHR